MVQQIIFYYDSALRIDNKGFVRIYK